MAKIMLTIVYPNLIMRFGQQLAMLLMMTLSPKILLTTLKGFHFHSLRHVHVVYLLGQGVDIYAISKRLGHSNITVTLNTYSYLVDEYKAKNDTLIIDKLAEL